MEQDILKRKLRRLKKTEIALRYGRQFLKEDHPPLRLLWDEYFSIGQNLGNQCRYSFDGLLAMESEKRKEVFDEYLLELFCQVYGGADTFLRSDLLTLLQLPFNATVDQIKVQFRALALQYHPDHGGSNEKMVQLLDEYHHLLKQMNPES